MDFWSGWVVGLLMGSYIPVAFRAWDRRRYDRSKAAARLRALEENQ